MAVCGHCGGEAKGFATIDEMRFCHEGKSPTCYELAQDFRALCSDDDLMRELVEVWGSLSERDAALDLEDSEFPRD